MADGLAQLEQSLARMRGAWLGGGSAATHCPPEWAQLVGQEADAELRIAALAGQALQVVFRPTAGALETRSPLPRLVLPTVNANLRSRIRRLQQALKAQPLLARNIVVLVAQRGFTLHPADWMPSANDAWAPDVYAPWIDWATKAAPKTGDATAAISAETWGDWPPAARKQMLEQLRERDPDKAREIIAAKAGAEPAEKRVDLISILAAKLSEKDADYLASLANDRSDRVKAVARHLLARLGRAETAADLTEELAAFMSVGKAGILSRRTVVSFNKLQNDAQRNRRWELFSLVTFSALAKQLGLSEDELAEAIPVDDAEVTNSLAQMVLTTAPERVIEPLMKRIAASKQALFGAGAQLAQRLAAGARLALAQMTVGDDEAGFPRTLEFVGDALGGLSIETVKPAQAYRDFSMALMAWTAGGENTTAAEHISKQSLINLGFLLDTHGAEAVLAQAVAVGLSPSEPALDLLHLNAALKPETSS